MAAKDRQANLLAVVSIIQPLNGTSNSSFDGWCLQDNEGAKRQRPLATLLKIFTFILNDWLSNAGIDFIFLKALLIWLASANWGLVISKKQKADTQRIRNGLACLERLAAASYHLHALTEHAIETTGAND